MRVSIVDPSLFTLPYDRALAAGLREGGHDVTLHGRQPNADDGSAGDVDLTADFYRVANSPAVQALPRPLRLTIKGVDHAWSLRRLLRRLRRQRPDVIHFQWLPLPLVDQLMLGAFAAIAPLVLTVHDTDPFNGDPSARLQRLGSARCLSHFDRLIVHTEQGRARMLAQVDAPDRVVVLPHGLLAAPVAGPEDPMSGPLSFTLFGKIKPYKGADVLIRAFAALPAALQVQARVRIIGKPYMDLAPCRALAASLGVAERVQFEPCFVADDAVATVFDRGTVAVFPYREIEASGVLFLALARGRPVVASRLGSFGEILQDGVQGHLVPPDDTAALSRAMAHLIEDRGFAASCAAAARTRAAQISSWAQIGRATAAVYRAAGAAAGRSRAMVIGSSTIKIMGGNC